MFVRQKENREAEKNKNRAPLILARYNMDKTTKGANWRSSRRKRLASKRGYSFW
jgi:hypothetical protein